MHVRDPRLPGGRLSLASGTKDPERMAAYQKAVLSVLKRPDADEIIRRLRLTKRVPGKISLPELLAAVEASDVTSLLAAKVEESDARPKAFERAMLGKMIDRFMQRVRADQRKGTARLYEQTAAGVEAAFGVTRDRVGRITHDVAVASITSEQGQDWLKGPKAKAGGQPWSPRTQRRVHSLVSQVWALAEADEEERAERAGIDPPALRNFWRHDRHRASVRPARVRRRPPEFLTRDEVARVLRANRGLPQAAWIATGVYLGLRLAELTMLRTGIDMDLDHGQVRIQPRAGEHPWEGPKSDNGNRKLEIGRRLMRWLAAHDRAGYAGAYFFRLPDSAAPLTTATASRWTARAFKAGGVKYGRGVESRTTHTMRHTAATWLAQAGINPATIAEILGDTVELVMKNYLHAFPNDRARALDILGGPANRLRR